MDFMLTHLFLFQIRIKTNNNSNNNNNEEIVFIDLFSIYRQTYVDGKNKRIDDDEKIKNKEKQRQRERERRNDETYVRR